MSTERRADPFVDMLERATEEPPDDLIERLRQVVASESLVSPSRRRQVPVGWTMALAAASVLVVALGVVLAMRGDDSEPATPSTLDGNYLPSRWLAQLDGPLVTADAAPGHLDSSSTILALDGVATARLHVMPAPDEESQPPSGEADEVWYGGRRINGSWLQLTGAVDDAATLQQVLDSVRLDGVQVDPASLPSGWQVVDDPGGVVTAALTGSAAPGTSTASANRQGIVMDGPQPGLTLMTIRTAEAEAWIERLRSLGGTRAVNAELSGGAAAVLLERIVGLSDRPSIHRSLVWQPDADVVVVAVGSALSEGELLAVASSARPVGAGEWSRYLQPKVLPLSTELCDALTRPVAGLEFERNADGSSQFDPAWLAVLSSDLFTMDAGSLRRVADAVAADHEGYERAVRWLAAPQRRVMDRMRDFAADPELVDELRGDPEATYDAWVVDRIATNGCGRS